MARYNVYNCNVCGEIEFDIEEHLCKGRQISAEDNLEAAITRIGQLTSQLDESEKQREIVSGILDRDRQEKYQLELILGECERIARDWKDTSQFTHAKAALEKIERTARAVDNQGIDR